MIKVLIESSVKNFSLTDLLVFSSLFVFLYNTFVLGKKVNGQNVYIVNLQKTQDVLNYRVNQPDKPEGREPENSNSIKILVAVTETFYKYGLISIGKNSEITKHLQPGNAMTIVYGENEYHGKVHSSVAGRIDGLTKMYKENIELREKNNFEIKYTLGQNKLTIL